LYNEWNAQHGVAWKKGGHLGSDVGSVIQIWHRDGTFGLQDRCCQSLFAGFKDHVGIHIPHCAVRHRRDGYFLVRIPKCKKTIIGFKEFCDLFRQYFESGLKVIRFQRPGSNPIQQLQKIGVRAAVPFVSLEFLNGRHAFACEGAQSPGHDGNDSERNHAQYVARVRKQNSDRIAV
jgi:hypothetical protein